MHFADSPTEAAWRQEIRSFLDAELTDDLRGVRGEGSVFASTARAREWRAKLAERNWLAPHWPTEYGGAGLSTIQQFVMNEEFAEAEAPANPGGFGVMMIGPTLIVHGSEEQKHRFLPQILKGEIVWCQGYSEPGSGSDLASLQTRAVRDGDDYIVNGQKIWTSGAQWADWMYLLVRTDPDAPKHRGISLLLLDMKSPGVSVRPLVNMAGTHEFNEVFFENVRVPLSQRVGEENRGWYAGATLLDFERSSIGNAVGTRKQIERLLSAARAQPEKTTCATRPGLRLEIGERWIEATVAKLLSYRVISMQASGQIPNHEASMAKLYMTELNQRVARLASHLFGLHGQIGGAHARAPFGGRAPYLYLRSVANTIEGGTSEIQRNIIAQRGLGLPR